MNHPVFKPFEVMADVILDNALMVPYSVLGALAVSIVALVCVGLYTAFTS